jgi:hypothetical protein
MAVDLLLVAAVLIVAEDLLPVVVAIATTFPKIKHRPLGLFANFVLRLAIQLPRATSVLILH